MLKNKLVFVSKEHFKQKILYSCAVVGGEKGVHFTGFGGSYFAFPTLSQCLRKTGNADQEIWKSSKITKKLRK